MRLSDLLLVDYVVDDDHPLGDVYVHSTTEKASTFSLPTDGRYVLYFDLEFCAWTIDRQDNLTWNDESKSWEIVE